MSISILNIRSPIRPADAAIFDVELGPHLRLYNLSLRCTSNGHYRILAPNACGKHSASFHPDLAEKITRAATAAVGGSIAHENKNIPR